MACVRFSVSGHVQGVFFRASAQTRARQLGLTGYAKNLADGSVEVVACGDATAIDRLQAWLHVGPPAAEVERVLREDCAAAAYADFARL